MALVHHVYVISKELRTIVLEATIANTQLLPVYTFSVICFKRITTQADTHYN